MAEHSPCPLEVHFGFLPGHSDILLSYHVLTSMVVTELLGRQTMSARPRQCDVFGGSSLAKAVRPYLLKRHVRKDCSLCNVWYLCGLVK